MTRRCASYVLILLLSQSLVPLVSFTYEPFLSSSRPFHSTGQLSAMAVLVEAEIDKLPVDLLSHIFLSVSSFTDLAQASCVCKQWRKAAKQSIGRRETLSFSGWKMDDESTARLVSIAFSLKELDISRSRWGCQITDAGLNKISMTKCVRNLTSVSLWGMTGITDKGVIQLVSRAGSLRHLNIGGTFITDESLFAIANNCPNLKSIVLWSCRHVTENGLIFLVSKCRKLGSINVWGTRIPENCFLRILQISPVVQIKPSSLLPQTHQILMWPVQ